MKLSSKWLPYSWADRCLIATAALLLWITGLVMRLMPFQIWRRLLVPSKGTTAQLTKADQACINRVVSAVTLASRYVPGTKCLDQALAAKMLLNWLGYSSRLRIGFAKCERAELQAHAWIEHRGMVLIGDRVGLSQYTLLPPFEREEGL